MVAHEDPAPDSQKLCYTALAQNAVRRVQLLGARDGRSAAASTRVVRRALAKLARNLLANSFVAWYEVSSLRRGAEEEEARRWRGEYPRSASGTCTACRGER